MKSSILLRLFAAISAVAIAACSPTAPSQIQSETNTTTGIMGGEEYKSILDSRSTTVILGEWKMNVGFVGLCAATLIDDQFILTAAHCGKDVTADRTLLVVFDNELYLYSSKIFAVVTDFQMHPSYNGQTGSPYDIAVGKFRGKFQGLPKGFKSRALPSSGSYKGDSLIMVGAGVTYPGDSSIPTMRKVRVSMSHVLNTTKSHIEIDQQDGKGICQGDSGGPLYLEKNNDLTLIGITSYTIETAVRCGASGFVLVHNYIDWIRDTMRALR
jgi:secreted trypsin-like serine protease